MVASLGAAAAETCPLPEGTDAGVTTVNGHAARRVERHGSGTGRWAIRDDERWLVFSEPSCRAVALQVSGSRGSPLEEALFLSPGDQSPPTAAEREVLLRWAGATMAKAENPADALQKAPWFPN